MPTPQRLADETPKSPSFIGETVRYVVVLGLLCFVVWYYYFRTPAHNIDCHTEGETMGTDYAVKVHGFPENADWNAAADAVKQALDTVDQAMSTFKPDSDVCRFNTSESTDWFSVSKETAEVVHLALELSKLTEGAFDITVAPLIDLWGFGPEREPLDLATIDGRVAETKNRVGFDKLDVRLEPPALKKSIPNLAIDLSAIAKGYAVDRIAKVLDDRRIGNYMIEVGGEVRCKGNKGAKGEWTIGIEKPLFGHRDEFSGVQKKLQLGNRSLATSGDSRNYRELDGVRFSHLIDPRTGFPTERAPSGVTTPTERLGSVSVIDTTCARADALATAMFVLGEKDGLALAEKRGIAVLFLLRSESTDHDESTIREAVSNTEIGKTLFCPTP